MTDSRKLVETQRALLTRRIADLEATLARARAEVAHCEHELPNARDLLAALSAEVGDGAHQSTAAPQVPRGPSVPVDDGEGDVAAGDGDEGDEGDDAGMAAMAAKFLFDVREPRTTLQIRQMLAEKGFEFLSGNPGRAIARALRKRGKRHGDVFSIKPGVWANRHNYTNYQFRQIKSRTAGTGGRSLEEHRARTIAGMEKARAAGPKRGAPTKLTPEKVGRFKRMLEEGVSKAKACVAIGISVTAYQYNRDRIDAWREGDPWPPPLDRDEPTADNQSHLRLVKTAAEN